MAVAEPLEDTLDPEEEQNCQLPGPQQLLPLVLLRRRLQLGVVAVDLVPVWVAGLASVAEQGLVAGEASIVVEASVEEAWVAGEA